MIGRTTLAAAALALFATAAAAQEVGFEADVLPFLRAKCFDCHNATKIKGGLRLDGRAWIERGGDGEDAVVAGDLEASGIHRRVTLPADDPDFMPAKGDPLTEAEIATMRRWIESGADFGDWIGETRGIAARPSKTERKPAGPTPFEQRLASIAEDLAPLSESELARAAGEDAQIERVADDSPLLRVSFLGSQARVDDARIRRLVSVFPHIAILDLGKTRVTDKGIGLLRGATRLVRLDLRHTGVTARGVAQLARLSNLESLNLYGAKAIDDAALTQLEKSEGLRRVYVWQTSVTPSGVQALTRSRTDLRVVGAPQLPVPSVDAPRANPRRRR